MESGNILEAVKIMVVGMATVFTFLLFMIAFLKAQGWFLTRFFPQKKAAEIAPSGSKISDATLQKIAIAAISEYKKKRG
ncbi:MAG: OadG family protein [Helicobacteraceae bacterium]|jgi:sodium pump decarboxylase gamma subunit|nr:OadG family protein [Helicobacteraceae bacterium]